MKRSNDKATLSHIERRYFVAPHTRPGADIRYGDWSDTEISTWYDGEYHPNNPLGSYVAKGIPLTVIELATGSDYSGTLVEISNARVLKERFPWLVTMRGGHGTRGVAYLGKREHQNDELIEAIDALSDYPLVDEDDHSTLECERESEAWSEDGEQDFCKALAEYLDEIDEDHEHEITDASVSAACLPMRYSGETMTTVWALWREGCEAFNVNGGSGYANEQGDSIYFYIDDWIDSARKPNYPGGSDYFRAARDTVRESLIVLAHFSRTTDDTSEGANNV